MNFSTSSFLLIHLTRQKGEREKKQDYTVALLISTKLTDEQSTCALILLSTVVSIYTTTITSLNSIIQLTFALVKRCVAFEVLIEFLHII
jgi:hypothetical protein